MHGNKRARDYSTSPTARKFPVNPCKLLLPGWQEIGRVVLVYRSAPGGLVR